MPIKEDVSEKIICFDNIGKTGDILDFQATQLSSTANPVRQAVSKLVQYWSASCLKSHQTTSKKIRLLHTI